MCLSVRRFAVMDIEECQLMKDCIDEMLSLSHLRDTARSEFQDILDSIRGRKALVLDTELVGILGQILPDGPKFLKDYQVQTMHELKEDAFLRDSNLGRDLPENILYLVRPRLPHMKIIAEQLKYLTNTIGIRSQFRICFVPFQSTVCMHFLEEHVDQVELWPRVSFLEFKVGFVPFDTDLISLEMTNIFKQCYVDGDLTCLNAIASALHRFQSVFGVIPNVKSKGVGAIKVLQRLMHRRLEEESQHSSSNVAPSNNQSAQFMNINGLGHSDIDTLIILDRETDMISPLITPLTYEGLVDETFGIENGRIKVDASLLGNEDSGDLTKTSSNSGANKSAHGSNNEKVVMNLNGNDSIFTEIRSLSIERLGSYMQEKAIHIRERYAAFKGNKDASLAEIHEFVKKIPKLTRDFKSLNQHIHIAEKLKQRTDTREFRDLWQMERGMLEGEVFIDQIEEIAYSDVNRSKLYTIMRLICLQSLTSAGIRSNRYDSLRKLIVQTYGISNLYTLGCFERCGLLRKKDTLQLVETSSTWQVLRKSLRLLDDKVNMAKPEDINYVAAGYGPMSVRLVQLMLQPDPSQTTLLEALKLSPGPFLEFVQTSKAEELNELLNRQSSVEGNNNFQDAKNRSEEQGKAVPLSNETSLVKKKVMILIIGGISFTEICALRYLSNDPLFPFKFVIASTKVVNSSSFLSSME